ncbi:MAG: tripartite tricarboxylate transporter substrate binding protein [Proteobacteria bacterium]|nr:tripartite tricarboxylate transporter substrate binding protein [Burkholderiales bacterium]
MNKLGKTILSATLASLSAVAFAQSTYPTKPVTLVVAFPPGGAADIVARIAQPHLQDALKQPVVIINRAGAGGSLGTASVATAAPDGYTLLMALTSIATNPEADRINGRKPAFELNQLQPIAQISADPFVLMVRADSPYKTLQQLMDDARRRPGVITYGSSGNYGTSHVATQSLAGTADIKLLHVPYGGGAPTLAALLGGQVDFVPFAPGVAIAHVKLGKLRPLATFGPTRLAALPDVPTLKEAGYDSQYLVITGAFVPAGTLPPVSVTLRNAFRTMTSNPEFRAKMESAGAPVSYLDGPEFGAAFEAEAQRLNAVLKRIGKLE